LLSEASNCDIEIGKKSDFNQEVLYCLYNVAQVNSRSVGGRLEVGWIMRWDLVRGLERGLSKSTSRDRSLGLHT
jgi:hypothetical protein